MKLRAAWFALSLAWGAGGVPRPEHPQPQFVREAWLNLNGEWQFEFDDKDAGLRENWGASGRPLSRKITVPYCFEAPLSGVGDTSFHPVEIGRAHV